MTEHVFKCTNCRIELFPTNKRYIYKMGHYKRWTVWEIYYCLKCGKSYRHTYETTEDPIHNQKSKGGA